ncbi:MAG TPA: hypothetical protein VGR71_10555, partial [Nitrospira sp.]|nr:hypothetical protein [Nitrospira sp.]
MLYLVHQFFPEYYTGTGRFVFNLANTIQRFGSKVKVVTSSSYDDAVYDAEIDGVLRWEYRYKGIPVIALKRKRPVHMADGSSVEDNPHGGVAVRILLDEKPDIVHVG